MNGLVLLKLGGAVITEKSARESPRLEELRRLAREIASWRGAGEGRLIVGHGSGSFAHVAAQATRFSQRPGDPLRIAAVAAAARRLNGLVVDALIDAGIPATAIPGNLLARSLDAAVVAVRVELVADLMQSGLVPVLYGDAVTDRTQGGAIASTEQLLAALAREVRTDRIVLATDVDGVYEVDPDSEDAGDTKPIPLITPASVDQLSSLGGARKGATDVTGGMYSKVRRMVRLVEELPNLKVRIVNGLEPGAVLKALEDREAGGTVIRSD